jgi:hypothetical protein
VGGAGIGRKVSELSVVGDIPNAPSILERSFGILV